MKNINSLVDLSSPAFAILWVVLICGAVCLVAFFIRRYVILKKGREGDKTKPVKIDEKKVVEQELSRVLEKVEDEDIAKQIEDYHDESSN